MLINQSKSTSKNIYQQYIIFPFIFIYCKYIWMTLSQLEVQEDINKLSNRYPFILTSQFFISKFLASAGLDSVIIVNDLHQKGKFFKLSGHQSQINHIEFSPNGMILASCSKDKTLRLWNLQPQSQSFIIKAHNSHIRALNFSCDGLLLLTCADDKSVKCWSVNDKRHQFTLIGHKNWVRTCQFSPDARAISSAGDDRQAIIWDTQMKKDIQHYKQHIGVIHCLRFHPLGNCMASCSHDKKIKIYDLRAHKLIQQYDAHDQAVLKIDFHPYNPILISASDDSRIKLWDLRKASMAYNILGHTSGATCCKFSHHGDYFATGGGDNIINIWKTNFLDTKKEFIQGVEQLGRQSKRVEKECKQTNLIAPQEDQKRQKQDIIQIEQQDIFKRQTSQIIYRAKSTSFQTIQKPKKPLVPASLSMRMSTLFNQLEFITRTVQILDSRITNSQEQLNRIGEILQNN